ncbi:DsbA family protein [Microbacterium immunditiarum]|uniref:Protein-disulfide isomerase n=1 Tax=Microbacterium immunditiarum TaxID=337480 RepID=A0A7Y9GN34_9MICO|nr:thioredoxin domain-containing protein [Microbacterium immunditiarum]NYE19564.1 protein-disulfide isomerase [Microbacterium immunditiarum]
MSSDESPNVPAQRDRRHAVREKAQQVQAQQLRARAVRRVSLVTLLVAVVAAAAVLVTWVVTSSAAQPLSRPANVKDDGFIVSSVTGAFGAEQAPETLEDGAATLETATPVPTPTPTPSPDETTRPSVDIRVYVDYLSAGAKDFQIANVEQLSKWVSQDAATLSYYPVAMLTAKSNGTKYSLRAASAAACVATYSPGTFFAFNNELLKKQPDVDSDGYTDTELADLALGSGATSPKAVRGCIESQKYATWVKSATERALKGLPDTKGVALTAAPMVLVNGTPYVGALDDPKEFAQFVLTISSDMYYKSTPTPTPTPTQ